MEFRKWIHEMMSGELTAPWLSETWRAYVGVDRKAFEEGERGLKEAWRRVERGLRLKRRV
jgi:hypothetical protein